jgi:hypothetical protein
MKTFWGSGDIAPLILDFGTRWKWVLSLTPRPLYPAERTACTHCIGGWLGFRAVLDAVAKTKKIQSLLLPGIELRSPARSLATAAEINMMRIRELDSAGSGQGTLAISCACKLHRKSFAVLSQSPVTPVLQLSTTPWRRMGEGGFTSTPLTLALDGGKWSALPPEKEPLVPIG